MLTLASAAEHWCSSGFVNTDLDLRIHQLIVIGLIAHICIEATVRGHLCPDRIVWRIGGANQRIIIVATHG